MTQEISYRVRFTFPEEEASRETMLPGIDLFLRTMERADRTLAGTLGLELEYRRSLREMGIPHFEYEVKLSLHWPSQILLGAWPEPGKLRVWMEKSRRDLFEKIQYPDDAAEALLTDWDKWARESGLADSLMYTPPAADVPEALLGDLKSALTALGGSGAVMLD